MTKVKLCHSQILITWNVNVEAPLSGPRTRGEYWQGPGDTIRITILGSRYDTIHDIAISRYHDILRYSTWLISKLKVEWKNLKNIVVCICSLDDIDHSEDKLSQKYLLQNNLSVFAHFYFFFSPIFLFTETTTYSGYKAVIML